MRWRGCGGRRAFAQLEKLADLQLRHSGRIRRCCESFEEGVRSGFAAVTSSSSLSRVKNGLAGRAAA
jgi:hypothetical protein